MNAVMKQLKMERMGVRLMEEGREWRLPGFLYADDLALCGDSAEDLKMMMKRLVEVCRRRGLKVSGGKEGL